MDLVVIKETDAPFLERSRSLLEMLRPRVGTDLLAYAPEECEQLARERPFVREAIVRKGRVVYERGA